MKFFVAILILLFNSSCIFTKVDLGSALSSKVRYNALNESESENTIAVIRLYGKITSKLNDQGITVRKVESWLSTLRKNKNWDGVILDINSPGGSAAASHEIYERIKDYKEEAGIPVVAYVSEMAASGGYYIAQAADSIITNPNAMVGSIGVISVFISVEDLVKKKFKADVVTIKTGKFKDSGSLFRKMTSDEKKYIKQLTRHYYKNFLDVIAQERKIENKSLSKLADGRVFHPEAAKKNNLIDQVGTFKTAISTLHAKAKISDSKIIEISGGGSRSSFLNMRMSSPTDGLGELIPNHVPFLKEVMFYDPSVPMFY